MRLSAIGPRKPVQSPPYRQFGLTLAELLIGLAITSIVLGLAVGTRGIFGNYKTTSAVNDVLTDLYNARTEALKRQRSVTVCRSSDGLSCESGTDWRSV